MCGRYVSPEIAEAERNLMVDLALWREYERSYNVAPSDPVPVVRATEGRREGLLMRWGLIPYFCNGIPPKYSTINATIEKLSSNPSWRGPWQREQRCLLPAVGFYEWHLHADGSKQPFFIQVADQELFCFAGLWDSSRRDDGTRILSCALITMQGNELMRELHNTGAHPFRMPAILAREDIFRWLHGSPEDARQALRAYPADLMSAYPVSTRVNDPKNDDATLLAPAAQDPNAAGSASARDAGAETEPENLKLFS
jgi:putative SOS response-associated peptidase YedK